MAAAETVGHGSKTRPCRSWRACTTWPSGLPAAPMKDLAALSPNVFRSVEALAPGESEAAAGVEGAWGDARAAVLQKEREADARKSLAFALAEAQSVR
jgi:hypothetical protein